jgi:hypothetical protein
MTDLLPTALTSGVFLRREALAAGMSHRQIAISVRNGDWHRLRHGAYVAGEVYANASDAERHALVSRAVLMQSRTDAVLSHVSAVPEFGGPMWGLPMDVVHLTRTDRRAGRKEAGVRQHQGVLAPGDIETRNGVAVTSATRTAIDITTVVATEPALAVMNHLLHVGYTAMFDLRTRYADMQHHPFTLRTDLVLRLASPKIESVGESRTLYLCWRQSLPAPQPQWVVADSMGREFARLDFAWPEHKVWLEFDGREKYVKDLREGETVIDAVLREKQRESRISELTGWRCIRITWADLAYPERTARRIAALLFAS